MNDKLVMEFDITTIQHLGVKLYTRLYSVLAELIANAWDADATEVKILLNDTDKKKKVLIVEDNGNGMLFDEINNHFLLVGRNRRIENLSLFEEQLNDNSKKNGRKVIGKKGVGKLAVFGIADKITVNTIKDGEENEFTMRLSEIEKQNGSKTYEPKVLKKNKKTDKSNGTKIILEDIKRTSGFDSDKLGIQLAKMFSIFTNKNEINEKIKFYVEIIHNSESPFILTNELKYKSLSSKAEFSWNFPDDFKEKCKEMSYANDKNITGTIYTSEKPLNGNETGIVLYSRGKLVENNTFFSNRANDFVHAYMTGYFHVNFVDEEKKDLISTDRNFMIFSKIFFPSSSLEDNIPLTFSKTKYFGLYLSKNCR